MVGIVNYGMGNLYSVLSAFEMAGADARICDAPEQLRGCERVVLPGVGAFGDCMRHLREKGFTDALHEFAHVTARPVLGICLGMQAMARRSFEFGEHAGLGWFEADVVRLTPASPDCRVPHVGWNDVAFRRESPLWRGIPAGADFYFVHSFHMRCDDPADVEATCEHGMTVTASVRRGNILATQFHPEKSQDHGMRLIMNFLAWKP